MNYCSHCGAEVRIEIPEGDNRPRHICVKCHAVHYQNPKVVVGCLPLWQNKLLLCRRAIEPRHGLWTLPAGFMENGETTQEGAARETLEEANARVEVGTLYTLFNLPHIDQVYMLFLARLLDERFGPSEESLEVRLFREDEIPWGEIAFPVVAETLKLFYTDFGKGEFPLRGGTIRRISEQPRRYEVSLR